MKWIFIVEDLYDENIPNDDPPLDGPDTGVEQSMLWPIVGTIAAVSLLFMLWLAVPSKRRKKAVADEANRLSDSDPQA